MERNRSKEGTFQIVVSAIIENKEGKILVTQRHHSLDHRGGEWEVVSGRINQGEKSMQVALAREVREEIGIEVEILFPFRTFYFERGRRKIPTFGINFHCLYHGDNNAIKTNGEIKAYRWVTPIEAYRLIADSDMHQAISSYDTQKHPYSVLVKRIPRN